LPFADATKAPEYSPEAKLVAPSKVTLPALGSASGLALKLGVTPAKPDRERVASPL